MLRAHYLHNAADRTTHALPCLRNRDDRDNRGRSHFSPGNTWGSLSLFHRGRVENGDRKQGHWGPNSLGSRDRRLTRDS
jgi:hypothetical protein